MWREHAVDIFLERSFQDRAAGLGLSAFTRTTIRTSIASKRVIRSRDAFSWQKSTLARLSQVLCILKAESERKSENMQVSNHNVERSVFAMIAVDVTFSAIVTDRAVADARRLDD